MPTSLETALQVRSYASSSAGSEKLALSRVFSWRPLCALGRVSYAWYLWHWPGIALLHYTATPLTASICIALFAGSLALAGLSTRYFEDPTRRNPTRGFRER